MGWGFKHGGKGIIKRPCFLKVYDGSSEISSVSIEGKSPTKSLTFTYIGDNGKTGDGDVKITSNSSLVSVTKGSGNTFTLTFNGMDVDESSAVIKLSVAETKHFYASESTLSVTLKRSTPTITLSTQSVRIVGGNPTGAFTISSYDGDGALTVSSADTSYVTASQSDKNVTLTYVNGTTGGKSVNVTVGCDAGKFYTASVGVACTVTCVKSDVTLTLNATSATISGSAGSATLTATYSGLDGSTSNLSTLKASSNATGVATASISNKTVTVKYVTAGSATITVTAAANNYYNAKSATCTVSCVRTSVTIPSLASTSIAWSGSAVSVTVNNLNTSLVNQSGTTSANAVGSYTVYWSLKDTAKYCWSDGATAQKSASWSVYAATITFRAIITGSSRSWWQTYQCAYGTTVDSISGSTMYVSGESNGKKFGLSYVSGHIQATCYWSDSSSSYGGYTAYYRCYVASGTLITNGAEYVCAYYNREY